MLDHTRSFITMQVLLLFLCGSTALPTAHAQVTGTGSLKGRAYFDLSKGLGDTNSEEFTFGFRRIYFQYEMRMSETVTGRFLTDAAREADGTMRVFMKHAYVDWQAGERLTLRAGEQGTIMFGEIENIWGYRALAKTMQNEFGFRETADLGLSGRWRPDDRIQVNAMMSNGEGFKAPDDDAFRKAWEIQGIIRPVEGVLVSLHAGSNGFDGDGDPATTGDRGNALTLDLSAGRQTERYAVGGSVTRQSNYRATDGITATAISVFGRCSLEPLPLTALARFDRLMPEKGGPFEARTYLIAGLDWLAATGLSIIPNLQYRKVGNGDAETILLLTFYWQW